MPIHGRKDRQIRSRSPNGTMSVKWDDHTVIKHNDVGRVHKDNKKPTRSRARNTDVARFLSHKQTDFLYGARNWGTTGRLWKV